MKIAVLIPVYNAEKYLRECLDSLLTNAAHLSSPLSLSVFCLNDGSNDGSQAILDEYATRYPNVHVARQENAGVSVTRNRLMDGLPSEYEAFAFLDADDTVAPGMYAKLCESLERTGADIAECEWDGEERIIDDMSLFLLRRTAPGQWINVINKLYRRSAVAAIRFREGLCFEEDYFFNFEVHQAIRRKVLVPGSFYHYRDNPDSATHALDHRRYFDSATRRLRLSLSVFLDAGRIPAAFESAFRAEVAKDAYRMCIRKNLKKNGDSLLRRELFAAAGEFLLELEREHAISADGLNPIQRMIWRCCRADRYNWARILSLMT